MRLTRLRAVQAIAAASASAGSLAASARVAAADDAAPAAHPAIDPAGAIAAFVRDFDITHVPPPAVQRANLAFIDSLGVMIAGSHSEPARIVAAMVREEHAAPQATIAGGTLKSTPQLTALANGVALHALDYDVTTLTGQPTAPLVPALLAVAEAHHATPAAVFAAYVIGFEVAMRLVRACPTIATKTGWHPTSTIGTTAAAIACAKLLQLPPAAIVRAVGISASLASGLAVNFGTMTKPLHAGQGARNGVMAALLARSGFTANTATLEGNNGYFADFCRGLDWSLEPFADLGRRWDLAEIGFKVKPYACGGLGHTAIDAALAVRALAGADHLTNIASVHVGVTKYASNYVATSFPTTIEGAKFSVPYVIATSFVRGTPHLATFTEAQIADARVKAFAAKITVAIDPEFGDSVDPNSARVTATMNDGRTIEVRKDYPIGSQQVPMTDAQIEAKFLDCATGVVGAATARRLFASWRALDTQTSFAGLWPALATPAR